MTKTITFVRYFKDENLDKGVIMWTQLFQLLFPLDYKTEVRISISDTPQNAPNEVEVTYFDDDIPFIWVNPEQYYQIYNEVVKAVVKLFGKKTPLDLHRQSFYVSVLDSK